MHFTKFISNIALIVATASALALPVDIDNDAQKEVIEDWRNQISKLTLYINSGFEAVSQNNFGSSFRDDTSTTLSSIQIQGGLNDQLDPSFQNADPKNADLDGPHGTISGALSQMEIELQTILGFDPASNTFNDDVKAQIDLLSNHTCRDYLPAAFSMWRAVGDMTNSNQLTGTSDCPILNINFGTFSN